MTRAPDLAELGAVALTSAYNVALNRHLPQMTHLPANLAASGVLLLARPQRRSRARRAGTRTRGSGLRGPDRADGRSRCCRGGDHRGRVPTDAPLLRRREGPRPLHRRTDVSHASPHPRRHRTRGGARVPLGPPRALRTRPVPRYRGGRHLRPLRTLAHPSDPRIARARRPAVRNPAHRARVDGTEPGGSRSSAGSWSPLRAPVRRSLTLRLRSRSVLAPVVAHAALNVATLIAARVVSGPAPIGADPRA